MIVRKFLKQEDKTFNENDKPYNGHILHGRRVDYLQNRPRWDANKLLHEYFGSDLHNQTVNNLEKEDSRKNKFKIKKIPTKEKRVTISSILEVNPDQFEDSLKSCSLRLKTEKYQQIQKYLSKDKWEKLFGKTDMMKRRENRKKFYEERNKQIIEKYSQVMKLRHQNLVDELSSNRLQIRRGCLTPKLNFRSVSLSQNQVEDKSNHSYLKSIKNDKNLYRKIIDQYACLMRRKHVSLDIDNDSQNKTVRYCFRPDLSALKPRKQRGSCQLKVKYLFDSISK